MMIVITPTYIKSKVGNKLDQKEDIELPILERL